MSTLETTTAPKRYYGKYRGTVLDNADPMAMGRLLVQVPDVSNVFPSSWAMPCFPVTGKQMGTWFLPQIGAGVWVEFEQGDPDYPIWTGCYFGSPAEVPGLAQAAPPAVPNFVLQTQGQNTIMMCDLPAVGILLKSTSGAFIMINDVGITISNNKGATILLAGNTVTVNEGALLVS
jgi:uncharacterized protein involved in type VI secretion and phage assembly